MGTDSRYAWFDDWLASVPAAERERTIHLLLELLEDRGLVEQRFLAGEDQLLREYWRLLPLPPAEGKRGVQETAIS